MLATKKVKELMIPLSNYPTVYDTDCLKDATRILSAYLAQGKEHRSLLVFSKSKKVGGQERLVGVLTVRDILSAIKTNAIRGKGRDTFSFSWESIYGKKPEDELITKVGNCLRPLRDAFVQADQDVNEALDQMITKNLNMLAVFEGKKAVGIIRAIDSMKYITDMIHCNDCC